MNGAHISIRPILLLLAVATLPATLVAAELTQQERDDFFEAEIRPLLVRHCYECHSAEGKIEASLRLDGRAIMLSGGDSGPVAKPGKPDESLIIEAVKYESLEMPPNGKLRADEIDKLVRWVEMGMPWPNDKTEDVATHKPQGFEITEAQRNHWAFQPITFPAPPEIDDSEWNQTAIDRFIHEKRTAQGLQPNDIADRATLLRRITYDLTGLPPTPEELHLFLNDNGSNAWEQVIDRLLASPHYGERWGRHWLDLVCYADTAGDASDFPVMDAYKYRDYVIKSFNDDKPYNQFLTEQFAGDLLAKDAPPEKFAELTTATGMLAISRRFAYNDTNFLRFHLTIADLIDTTGKSILGLSVSCARCHDHKFEPISAKDYYALYGIFSSTKFTYPGAGEIKYPKDLRPLVPPDEVTRLETELKAKLTPITEKLQLNRLTQSHLDGGLEHQAHGKMLGHPWFAQKQVLVDPSVQGPFKNVFPIGKQGVRIAAAAGNFGFSRAVEPSTKGQQKTIHLNIDFRTINTGEHRPHRISLCHKATFSPAIEILIDGSQLQVRNGSEMLEVTSLKSGEWYNLQVSVDLAQKTYSGIIASTAQSVSFVDQALNSKWNGKIDCLLFDAPGTFGKSDAPQRDFDNIAVSDSPFLPFDQSITADAETQEQKWTAAKQEYTDLQMEYKELSAKPQYPTAYGVCEGKPANTRLQIRGEPDRLGEEVPRGFLEILGGDKVPEDSNESGRLQLAKWITSSTNPLTARVMANRLWHYHFNRGIVPSTNDFGLRGEKPSHPELLDYLASQLMKNNWSLKTLHREILLSRTYRLSSRLSPEARKADPDNTWLQRYSRHRLDAESLRDSLLFISGEIDFEPGGQHPFPPVSSWGFSQHRPFEAVYPTNKRSVYLMTQHLKRHPFLALFDGADPNATTGQRSSTTTPLQALYLMNDNFTHEQTRATARRLLSESDDDSTRIVRLFEMAYSRSPDDAELIEVQRFLDEYSDSLPATANSDELLWAGVVRAVLSSNEFLYLD